jgi:hypothetical protein
MKPKEYKKFSDALEKVLSVTHSEIKQREGAEKEQRKYKGKKRGPKLKPPASEDRVSDEQD